MRYIRSLIRYDPFHIVSQLRKENVSSNGLLSRVFLYHRQPSVSCCRPLPNPVNGPCVDRRSTWCRATETLPVVHALPRRRPPPATLTNDRQRVPRLLALHMQRHPFVYIPRVTFLFSPEAL